MLAAPPDRPAARGKRRVCGRPRAASVTGGGRRAAPAAGARRRAHGPQTPAPRHLPRRPQGDCSSGLCGGPAAAGDAAAPARRIRQRSQRDFHPSRRRTAYLRSQIPAAPRSRRWPVKTHLQRGTESSSCKCIMMGLRASERQNVAIHSADCESEIKSRL